MPVIARVRFFSIRKKLINCHLNKKYALWAQHKIPSVTLCNHIWPTYVANSPMKESYIKKNNATFKIVL